MVQWFLALPKRLFVALVLGAGILFVIFSDPPRSVCDSQVSAFLERTKPLIEIEEKKIKYKKTSQLQEKSQECGFGRTSGACFDLFQILRTVLREIRSVSVNCHENLARESRLKSVLKDSLELIVKLAWGDQPPLSVSQRLGPFDVSDFGLFCELKNSFTLLYSESEWRSFVEKILASLKEGSNLSREEKWARSIMSAPCK